MKNISAFPRPIGNNGASDPRDREVSVEAEGMSLLAYFAAHAPAEIPPWFTPSTFIFNLPEPVTEADIETVREVSGKSDADEVRNWVRSGGDFDLSDHLEHIRIKQCKYWEAKRAKEKENQAHLYFEWRWFYAIQMLNRAPSNVNEH